VRGSQRRGEEEKQRRGQFGGSKPVLLFVIYGFHKHEWLNL
jgi:hypothetical protein